MNAVSKKKTPQAAPNLSPALPRLSPVHGGLSVAGIYQLIEQIREADHERDLRAMGPHKSDLEKVLADQRSSLHQALLWDYQMALANAASFLKPLDLRDVLCMLELSNDRLNDLVENEWEAGAVDFADELKTLRRMVQGCLGAVANEIGVILHPTTQSHIQGNFPEMPR